MTRHSSARDARHHVTRARVGSLRPNRRGMTAGDRIAYDQYLQQLRASVGEWQREIAIEIGLNLVDLRAEPVADAGPGLVTEPTTARCTVTEETDTATRRCVLVVDHQGPCVPANWVLR